MFHSTEQNFHFAGLDLCPASVFRWTPFHTGTRNLKAPYFVPNTELRRLEPGPGFPAGLFRTPGILMFLINFVFFVFTKSGFFERALLISSCSMKFASFNESAFDSFPLGVHRATRIRTGVPFAMSLITLL